MYSLTGLMAKGKYNRDYRLIEEFKENGRVRTDYEYIGDPWLFHFDEKTVEKEKKKAFVLTFLAAAAFILALVPFTNMMHKLWIALPYSVTAVPIFMMGDLVISMQKWHEPMEHRNADKLNNSFPARSLAIAYLSFVALIGEIVYLVMNGLTVPGDTVMIVCTALILWCALMLFRSRAMFRAEVKDT